MKRAGTVLVWVLSAFQAFVMIGSGIQKFTSPAWERMFRVWGYPDHFYIVIGVIEAACGLGLLVPRLASPCALTLACVMIGAAVTQITRNHGSGVGEIVFLTMLLIITYARWPGILARRNERASVSAAG
jgi:uncharacterized membrane protein YphA (DoxX/SURF4 family)